MTSTTEAPRAAPADEHHRRGVRSSPWPVALFAVVGWFVGLSPWLVRRSSQGTFGTPWNPRNDLRSALLPFHHQLLMLLLVVAVMAASSPAARRCGAPIGAGGASARSAHDARRRLATGCVGRPRWPDPDLAAPAGPPSRPPRLRRALTVTGVVAGLVLGLAISLGGPALRAVAAAPVAVVGADWLGQLALGTAARRTTAWLPTVLAAPLGVVVGALLAATVRSRLVVRVVAWVCALALLALTAAALTAARTSSRPCAARPCAAPT